MISLKNTFHQFCIHLLPHETLAPLFSNFSLKLLHLLSKITYHHLLRSRFRYRGSIPCTVSIVLNRTERRSELSLTERSSKWILGLVSSVRPKWRSVLDRTLVQKEGSRSCVGMAGGPSPIEYFEADRVNLGWQLMSVPVTTPTE
ncbi:hypothetical protein LR48_Vigan211s000600 [Vigna angularis]|uniref:Uncharacterized protein n=1 Tax=Phaseolus angularis TaxID=3914 RepID=A0A0L9T6M6_PHAAN|nr:hypothetical protein LR48_Vigan211s000600 [Vigna angularis]